MRVRVPLQRLARYVPARGTWALPAGPVKLFLADETFRSVTVKAE